jgi:hypothetical protein
MNLNYRGSVAEMDMKFSSTTEVITSLKNELFNAVSIYIPASLAAPNIVGWGATTVTQDEPKLFTCVVDNYRKVMKGKLLDEWEPVFRQDANIDVVLYLIVFADDETTSDLWEITARSITFEPITKAFAALFHISYFKTLFDESYDGKPELIPATPGAPASAVITLTNNSSEVLSVGSGVYSFSDSDKTYGFTVAAEEIFDPGDTLDVVAVATSVGEDNDIADGQDVADLIDPALPSASGTPGTAAEMEMRITNNTGAEVVIPSSAYTWNDGTFDFSFELTSDITLADGETSDVTAYANTVGIDATLEDGSTIPFTDVSTILDPTFPADVSVIGQSSAQGTDPVAPTGFSAIVSQFAQGVEATPEIIIPVRYFDFALALAYQCKNDKRLSWYLSMVKIHYANRAPDPADNCWIRLKTRQEQLSAFTSLVVGDRQKYYWAALYLMECENASVFVHSEFVNIIPLVLAGWFVSRNTSGHYIGNKLSKLRLTGTRIKPCGWPSWLDSSVNENDPDGILQFKDMNVGCLRTISDASVQDCELLLARGVTGIPLTMQMIADFVDYECAQRCADMVDAKGTLTNPMLTDSDAYSKIQGLVESKLALFSKTGGRLSRIQMMFPDFDIAKVGRTAISVASAWRATYVDDLDSVQVTGGIFAE